MLNVKVGDVVMSVLKKHEVFYEGTKREFSLAVDKVIYQKILGISGQLVFLSKKTGDTFYEYPFLHMGETITLDELRMGYLKYVKIEDLPKK